MTAGEAGRIDSILARLRNRADETHQDFNRVLTLYSMERFLYRLSVSEYRSDFVLKGAMLFHAWGLDRYRTTRDIDLLGSGDSSPEHILNVVKEICTVPAELDGLQFDPDSARTGSIGEFGMYPGIRVKLQASLGSARIHIQIDIGYGDSVYPAPTESTIPPSLPELSGAQLNMYPPESVVSEKFHAIVAMGGTDSRVKDLYAIDLLAGLYGFDYGTLRGAVLSTFERRGTEIGGGFPEALTVDYYNDPTRRSWWSGFTGRNGLGTTTSDLPEVGRRLSGFLKPLWVQYVEDEDNERHWEPGGPWT